MEKIILSNYTPEQLTGIINEAVRKFVLPIIEMNTSAPREVMLSRKEAANFLHISLVTLRDWTMRGKIKAYKIGDRVLYKASELEQALKQVEAVKY